MLTISQGSLTNQDPLLFKYFAVLIITFPMKKDEWGGVQVGGGVAKAKLALNKRININGTTKLVFFKIIIDLVNNYLFFRS